jgi:hypothetical protein
MVHLTSCECTKLGSLYRASHPIRDAQEVEHTSGSTNVSDWNVAMSYIEAVNAHGELDKLGLRGIQQVEVEEKLYHQSRQVSHSERMVYGVWGCAD